MIYVGIDIAKLNHFASAVSSDGEVMLKPFKFTNDYDGFHKLKSSLDSFDPDQLIIGLESRFVSLTLSRHRLYGRTTSVRPKRIRSIP